MDTSQDQLGSAPLGQTEGPEKREGSEEPTCSLASSRHRKFAIWLISLGMVALVALAAGCAPRTADPSSGSGSEDTTATVAWSMQSDCATCHLAETNEQDPTAPATVHEQEGTTCITCHADEEKMTAVHEGATADLPMPTRLKKTEVDPTLCGSCHEADELATLTVASTVITDTEGTVVNPHDIPDNSSHNSITCINCHQVHEPAASLPDNSLNTCFNCHHEKVLQCGTCHD